jgi:hypothetical protein
MSTNFRPTEEIALRRIRLAQASDEVRDRYLNHVVLPIRQEQAIEAEKHVQEVVMLDRLKKISWSHK